MISKEQAISILKETGVMLEGHFLLTSGRHSDRYMQCARLFEDAKYSEMLCAELASQFKDQKVDLVIGPALGGVIISYEVSRALGVRNIFAERQDGVMTLRRGFYVPKGARILVVEDVITTGGSVMEVMNLVRAAGGIVVGVGVIVDRSNGQVQFDVPIKSILSMEVTSFEATDCPLCAKGIPAVKPGSRNLK